MQVQKPLEFAQRHYKMLLEGLQHKVLQLLGRRVGVTPPVSVGVTQAGGGGAGVTVDGTVEGGGGSVHGFVLPVVHRFLLDCEGAPCPPGVQVLLEGGLVLLHALLRRLQALLAADLDQV